MLELPRTICSARKNAFGLKPKPETETMKILAFAIVAALAVPSFADNKPAPPNPGAVAATKEIEKAFGFVPGFIRQFPQVLLSSWWEGTKALSFNPNTA